MTGAGKLFLGDRLASQPMVNLNPVALAGWAGLVINALNSIPAGTQLKTEQKQHACDGSGLTSGTVFDGPAALVLREPTKSKFTTRIAASVDAGELDGGRVAAGLWGRPAGRALSTLSTIILGIGAEQ